jgi:hypothetical protein
MDFMRLLRSFEEFLFEAASWLLFYPLIVWRIVTRPLTTMAYSDAEQSDDDEHRYDDALSPPLLLLVTVVLVNLVGAALHMAQPAASSALTQAILASPQNLAIFRGLVFSLIPLVAAATLLKQQGVRLSRESLRSPFYAQCYLATPCAIVVGLGSAMVHRPEVSNLIAFGLMAAGAAWFLVTQTRWFAARLAIGGLRAAWLAAWALVRALLYLLLLLVPVALV